MEPYIKKADIVAEINRVLNSYDPNEITSGRYALVRLRDFLDTLEVKEVDLEKEVKDYIYTLPHSRTGIPGGWKCSWSEKEIIKIVKHFFGLGLKTQKEVKRN